MKATFALLVSSEVHNAVRRLAWRWHRRYGLGTIAARLPPHTSLKQPFAVEDLDALRDYMAEFAMSIVPFVVRFTEVRLIPTTLDGHEVGILWLDVEESVELRELHNRLNEELRDRFGSVEAPFDGAAYHFHLTVAMGGASLGTYRRLYSELADPTLNLRFTARELAMFVYDEPMGPQADFLDYCHLRLGA